MKINKSKLFLFIVIISLIGIFYISGAYRYLDFKSIQSNLEWIKNYQENYPYRTFLIFVAADILLTSLSIPGSIVLTLLAGAIFGVIPGTLIISIATCFGATFAFIISRYLFKDLLMKHFRTKFEGIDRKFRKSGKTYLFSIRLVPVSPFVVINILMALTSIRLWTYIWITFVGMMPGTFVYVYAGRKIASIQNPAEILTPPLLITLTILGILPLFFKWIVTLYTSRTYRV